MYRARTFPTQFAMALCRDVGLYDKDPMLGGHAELDKKWDFGLSEFQQMIIGGAGFENALFAFHAFDLTKEQIAVLKIIEKSTIPWVLGHITGILTEKLNCANSKDVISAAQIIIEDLISNGNANDAQKAVVAKRLIVEFEGSNKRG